MSGKEDTQFGRDLIAALEEARTVARGETEPGRVHLAPDVPDVRAIRERMGLSRPAFAARFGLQLGTIRDWEQGLRKPDTAAKVLLRVIERSPEAVAQAVAA